MSASAPASTMKAAVLRRFRKPLTIERRPKPRPRGEEVLVRVLGAGLCHSDLHIADGEVSAFSLPRVLGHEIAGEVDGLGRVLVYMSWGCGRCAYCARGDEQLCPNGTDVGWGSDGGYAEWVKVPSRRYLLPIHELDPVLAAPLADAGITPYRAVQRIREGIRPEDTVAVIGCGGLGQFAIQYLRLLTPARVVAVDVAAGKRARALRLGADEAVGPTKRLPTVRAVLDFVGSNATLARALESVEQGGVIVQVGAAGGSVRFGLDRVPYEVQFTTSIYGSRAEMRAVIDLARSGRLQWHVEALPIERINEAMARLRRGTVEGRIVLTP